jgi:hypothetical protein
MLKVTINCEGKTLRDIELAIEEAKKRILKENTSGFDSNEDGSFDFYLSGKEE